MDLEHQDDQIQVQCLNLPSLLWHRSAPGDPVYLETQSLPSGLQDHMDLKVPQGQGVLYLPVVLPNHRCTEASHQAP